jgi:hypothetical protein
LGDRADRVLVFGDIHILDHATPRDRGTAAAASSAAADELRQVVGFSVADELEKLEHLKNSNAISNEEYLRLRARAVQ